jgi:hypothetical protein
MPIITTPIPGLEFDTETQGADYLATKLIQKAAAVAVFEFKLPTPILIPGELINGNALANILAAASASRERINEFLRQVRNIEIRKADMLTFLRAGNVAGGHWALGGRLSIELGAFAANGDFTLLMRVEFAAYAEADYRRYALVGIAKADTPRFRIDFDEFNFSLPEVNLPDWDLQALGNLNLNAATARLFDRLGSQVIIAITAPPGVQPVLKLEAGTGRINWGIVTAGPDPIDAAHLASLTVTIAPAGGGNGPSLKVTDFRAGQTDSLSILNGTFIASGIESLPAGTKRLGPLEISWDDMKLEGEVVDGKPAAKLTFARVTLRDFNDPSTSLSLEGELAMNPSGVRVRALSLVEPFSLPLAIPGTWSQMTAPVLKLALSPGNVAQDKLRALLTILGKLAAVLAKAAALLDSAVEAVIEAGNRLIAQFISEVLSLVGALADGVAIFGLELEIRIGTDPFELRQVIIRLSRTTNEWKVDSPGFSIQLAGGLKPGLLLDFPPCQHS